MPKKPLFFFILILVFFVLLILNICLLNFSDLGFKENKSAYINIFANIFFILSMIFSYLEHKKNN